MEKKHIKTYKTQEKQKWINKRKERKENIRSKKGQTYILVAKKSPFQLLPTCQLLTWIFKYGVMWRTNTTTFLLKNLGNFLKEEGEERKAKKQKNARNKMGLNLKL